MKLLITTFALCCCVGSVLGQSINLLPFATSFNRPNDIENAGDARLFVAEMQGLVKVIDASGATLPVPFLDIRDSVFFDGNEMGLQSIVFHPQYPDSGYFYLYYNTAVRETKISRFEVSADPNLADATSETTIARLAKPGTFIPGHNGGDMSFGPDGKLYIPIGDGGCCADGADQAQNTLTPFGGILRLDVDAGLPYSVPSSNPWLGAPDTLSELIAIGVRNPWRASFDRLTGDYWFGDVGDFNIEEVNVIPAAEINDGVNFGWPCFEGNSVYVPGGCDPSSDFTFPVEAYDHSSGDCAIIGGFVYRGEAFPDLYGKYVYSDYCSGRFFTLEPDGSGGWISNLATVSALLYTTYGEDFRGEMYVANHLEGNIYRVAGNTLNCLAPLSLNATVTSTAVQVSWDRIIGAVDYQVQGRVAGVGGPASLTTTDNSLVVTGLTPGTSYEWRVSANCGTAGVSPYSGIGVFTTTTLKSDEHLPDFTEIKIYPNPARSILNVMLPGDTEGQTSYSLHDILGQVLLAGTVPAEQEMLLIDVSGVASGLYTVRIERSGLQLSRMVSVE